MKLLAIGGAEKGLSGRAVLQGGVDAPKGQVLFGQVVVLVRHQVDAFALPVLVSIRGLRRALHDTNRLSLERGDRGIERYAIGHHHSRWDGIKRDRTPDLVFALPGNRPASKDNV